MYLRIYILYIKSKIIIIIIIIIIYIFNNVTRGVVVVKRIRKDVTRLDENIEKSKVGVVDRR